MIAILSDIHGNLEAFKSVLKEVVDDDLRMIVILGDLVDYGADSSYILDIVLELNKKIPVFCLRGNHEDAIIAQDCSRFRTDHGRKNFEITSRDLSPAARKKLDMLCYTSIIRLLDSDTTLCHAMPSESLWGKAPKVIPASQLLRPLYQKTIIGGHSHIQGWCVLDDGSLYVNPGSVGQPRNGDPRAQYLICDDLFTTFLFKRVNYDVESASQKIVDSGRPKFLSTRLYFGI